MLPEDWEDLNAERCVRYLASLREAYCQNVGVEYRHIQDPDEKAWIQERIEPQEARVPLDSTVRLQILKNLVAAEGFEKYLHTKFIGHKRFSLEGAETTIAVLATILSEAASIAYCRSGHWNGAPGPT